MEYAIIEASGRQFWIEPRKYYTMNHVPLKRGTKVILNNILLVNQNDEMQLGFPYLNNVKIEGIILNHFDGQKVLVYKMKPKKKYKRKNGHRQ
jgi:large subunit ribosomal protein L21